MKPRRSSLFLSLAILALYCSQLSADERQFVIQLDPELHKHFSQDVRNNAREWFAIIGSTQPVQVLQLKDKPNTSQNPAYILALRLGRTWCHGQNHRQFVLQGQNENAIGGGMKMVTKTYQVLDFSVSQAMAELGYRLIYRDEKSTLITSGVLPCVQLARDGVQLPPQLLEARSRQILHQTVTEGLAQQLNRRLQEDVAQKIVKGAQLKKRGNTVVVETAFKNFLPTDLHGQFTFQLGTRTLAFPFQLRQGESKSEEAGVIAAGFQPTTAQLGGLSQNIKVTIDKILLD